MGIFNFVREAGSKVGLGESPSAAAAEAEMPSATDSHA